jgi:hypothetical protein
MNFLEGVKRLRQEAGVSGTGPTTVVSQTGEMKRLVDWYNTAWLDVQTDMPDYNWMRGSFTLTLSSGDPEYTPADASLTDHRSWVRDSLKVYLTSVADEVELEYVSYAEFRPLYMVGSVSTGQPFCYTVKPDKTLRFYPTPNAAYTVTGEYQKTASEMTADADEPGLPAEYHMAIVYRALMKYGRYEAAPEVYDDAKAEYKRMTTAIKMDQLPDICMGGPLL